MFASLRLPQVQIHAISSEIFESYICALKDEGYSLITCGLMSLRKVDSSMHTSSLGGAILNKNSSQTGGYKFTLRLLLIFGVFVVSIELPITLHPMWLKCLRVAIVTRGVGFGRGLSKLGKRLKRCAGFLASWRRGDT
jgi:hypothetical protein